MDDLREGFVALAIVVLVLQDSSCFLMVYLMKYVICCWCIYGSGAAYMEYAVCFLCTWENGGNGMEYIVCFCRIWEVVLVWKNIVCDVSGRMVVLAWSQLFTFCIF